MNIPSGLFARQRLDEQARMVRDHLTERAFAREVGRHTEATSTPNTQVSKPLASMEASANCSVRPVSAERPA